MHALSGPMTQLAWVVGDLEAAETEIAATYGVDQWTRLPDIHFGPDACTLRGQGADFVAHISLAYVGDLQLELIQPVTGESIYTEFLTATGGGLHHGCWEVPNLQATLEDIGDLEVVQEGSMADGELLFAYLEPGLPGLAATELVQVGPGMRSFFDQLKPKK